MRLKVDSIHYEHDSWKKKNICMYILYNVLVYKLVPNKCVVLLYAEFLAHAPLQSLALCSLDVSKLCHLCMQGN